MPLDHDERGRLAAIRAAAALATLGLGAMAWVIALQQMNGMAVVGVLMLAQKVLPARAAIDVPLALALVALGMLILVAPSSLPGFMPAM